MSDFTVEDVQNAYRESQSATSPLPKDYQEGEHFKSQRTSSFSICSIPHVSL